MKREQIATYERFLNLKKDAQISFNWYVKSEWLHRCHRRQPISILEYCLEKKVALVHGTHHKNCPWGIFLCGKLENPYFAVKRNRVDNQCSTFLTN